MFQGTPFLSACPCCIQANVYAIMNIISAVWTLIPVLYEESGTIQASPPRSSQHTPTGLDEVALR